MVITAAAACVALAANAVELWFHGIIHY